MTMLTVNIKHNVYGEDRIYPACEKSKVFARIAGRKTLTAETIALIKQLGYGFELSRGDELKRILEKTL